MAEPTTPRGLRSETAPVTSLSPGAHVDHYRIEAIVGAGSMGDVYRATDTQLGRSVAIKILSARHRDNRELRSRFLREARAVAATSHPNVVQVFTTGEFDGRPYLAMEFLAGVDLGSSVEHGGPWPSLPTAQAMVDAARGLQAAANAGLIHRDVKPSNLVRLDSGAVKVTDFGLAKPIDPGDEPALTAMGVVVGTPDYIAPEQARGEAIDARVDIYALGGTAFFMLTGTPPFRTGRPNDDKYLKVVARHLRDPVPSARSRVAGVDEELSQLANDMMAKKPSDRPGYPEIVTRLESIIGRLQAEGAASALPRAEGQPRRGGSVAPTPVVARRAASGQPEPRGDDGDDSARTWVRQPTARPMAADSAPVEPAVDVEPTVVTPAMPTWLVVVTALSAGIFLLGLGLTLFGPMPAAHAPDAGIAATRPGAAAAAPAAREPRVPPGMVLVERADGTPWFWVSVRPVTAAELAHDLLEPPPQNPDQEAAPATDVSFEQATRYAAKRGARLLTAAEWQAATAAPGFEFPGRKLWEWIAGADPSGRRLVRAGPDRAGLRRPGAHSDVTFRLARDLARP
jgi:eukaryotic-like serine/threonine-protein kinase